MANVQKHAKGAIGNLSKHYERAKNEKGEYVDFGNQEIDTTKTHLNYNLAPKREISQGQFIKQRCSEVKCLNRKDVKVMCSWVITQPKELPQEESRKFFEESYNFLKNRYGGEKNVVSSYIHMDEKTPHMHFSFVPVTHDKKKNIDKVASSEVVNRLDLQTFHKDLDKHMEKAFGRNIGVLNEATKEGNKEIKELKFNQLNDNVKKLQKAEKILVNKIKDLDQIYTGKILTAKEIDKIKPEKGFGNSIKNISLDTWKDVSKTLMQVPVLKSQKNKLEVSGKNKDLKINNLELEVKNLNQKIPKLDEKIKQYQMQEELENFKKIFEKMPQEFKEKFEEIEKDMNQNKSKNKGIEI